MKEHAMSKESSGSAPWKPVVVGVVVGVLAMLAFLLLFAVVLTMKDFSDSALMPMSTVTCGLAAFLAGFSASKANGKQGMLTGLATGAALFVLLLLIGLFVSGVAFTYWTGIKFAVLLIAAALGGVTGVNTRSKRKFKLK